MAGALFLAGRVLLAAIFAVAGLSKLAAMARTREGLIEFGVSPRLAGASAVILVIAELSVATALLPVATAWYGAVGAVVLLAAFSAAIAANLLRNRRPNCNCFGQLHSAPIGWPTFVRNVVLAAIAGLVVSGGRDPNALSLVGWTRSLSVAESVSLVVAFCVIAILAALAALLVQILRQQGRMLLRFDELEQRLGGAAPTFEPAVPLVGLPPGTPAPAFALPGLEGESTSLEGLLQENKPALLLFSNPDCGPCQTLLPEVAGWQRDLGDHVKIALIAEGSADANRSKVASRGVKLVLLQREREVAEQYQAYGTPAAVAIAPDGRVASHVAQGGEAIRNLVLTIQAGELPPLPAQVETLRVGEPAPELTFKTVAGEEFALSGLRGTATLLLFWNQGCGFCQQMLPDLKAWEATGPPPAAPRLVVVSSGSAADNSTLNLQSAVVLDEGSRAAQAFGATGTPMAVLLDGEGRVASQVAAGAQEVFALANREVPPGGNGRVTATVG